MLELDFTRIQFAGRKQELQQLEDAVFRKELDTAVDSATDNNNNNGNTSTLSSSVCFTPALVLVHGPAGSGKTALLQHFIESKIVSRNKIVTKTFVAAHSPTNQSNNNKKPSSSIIPSTRKAAKRAIVGKGKFEQQQQQNDHSNDMPLAVIMDAIDGLIENVIAIDPNWAIDTLSNETKREIRRLSKLVPRILDLLGETKRKDDDSTVDGDDDDDNLTTSTGTTTSTRVQDAITMGKWALERMRITIRALIRSLSQDFIVIFVLDDIQWADQDTIKLLSTSIADTQHEPTSLFCTHRDLIPNTPGYAFHKEITSIQSNTSNDDNSRSAENYKEYVRTMTLGDLDVEAVAEIIANLLECHEVERVSDLARIVHHKTGGTVFFVIQYMRLLYEKKLIYYSMKSFQWEHEPVDRITADTDIADNVMELVTNRISSLPKDVQYPITTAAFIGFTKFDAGLLFKLAHDASEVLDVDPRREELLNELEREIAAYRPQLSDLKDALAVGVKEGILEQVAVGCDKTRWHKFAHDRIKEATLVLAPKGKIATRFHLHVGRRLQTIRRHSDLALPGGDDANKLLLLSTRHLNEGSEDIVDEDERLELARMNLEASQVVFERSAYQVALHFLRAGISLLDERTKWRGRHYGLTLNLMTELASVQFCCGHHEDNWDTIDEVLTHAKAPADKACVYRLRILALSNEGQHEEALKANLAVLDELGTGLPRRFRTMHILKQYTRLRLRLRGKTNDELAAMCCKQCAEDDFDTTWFDFMLLLVDTAQYQSTENPYVKIAMLHLIHRMLDHGYESFAHLAYGALSFLFEMTWDLDRMYYFGKLSVSRLVESNLPKYDALMMGYQYACVLQWKEPVYNCLDKLLTSYKLCLDNGIIEGIFFPILCYCFGYLQCGLTLDPLLADMVRFIEILDQFGQAENLLVFKPLVVAAVSLMGYDTSQCQLLLDLQVTSNWLDMKEPVTNNFWATQIYVDQKMRLGYYFDDYNRAYEASKELDDTWVKVWLPTRHYYRGLSAFALYKTRGKRKHHRRGMKFLRLMEKYVKLGNVNGRHYALLLHAESMAMGGKKSVDDVRAAFDKAIVAAGKAGFVNDLAIGNELAGVYFLRQGDESWAITYLGRSYESYRQWGAMAKCRHMEEKYGKLLEDSLRTSRDSSRVSSGHKASSKLRDIATPDSGGRRIPTLM